MSTIPTHHYAVVIRELPRQQLEHLSAPEKYARLHRHSAEVRERLQLWLNEQGLTEEVSRWGETTAFNTLFLDASERVANRLRENNDVDQVAEAPELVVAPAGQSTEPTKARKTRW